MENVFVVNQLDKKTADEIKQKVSNLSKQSGKDKNLPVLLDNTTGNHLLALDLAKFIHSSKIDMIVEARGSLDAAGTILCAAGKKGERHASLDTVFTPFEENAKSVRLDRLSPKNQSVLATLGTLRANRRRLKSIAPKAENLSAFEAKSLDILDRVDSFISKYPKDKSVTGKSFKKSSGKKSSKK